MAFLSSSLLSPAQIPVGASLLAKASARSKSVLAGRTLSRAGSLPQGVSICSAICCGATSH
ncbi:hypothetical protein C3E97_021395 [Pseudomonas sp. MWU12-2115]|nr:hypothetical protein C3E97_021395 [Pseudomonas sp. MWU12-2115]